MDLNSSEITESNVTFSNLTGASESLTPIWALTSTFFLAVCIIGTIANFIGLVLFAKNPQTITPFEVYVINLLGANLANLLIQYPLAIKANLYDSGWNMGNHACSLYLYSLNILDGGIVNSHAIISINRAWALVHPLSFRRAHTKRFTLTVCGIMWLYIHAAQGSFWLADLLYFRVNVQVKGCMFNTEKLRTWTNVDAVVVYITPLLAIVLSFGIVMVGKVVRSRASITRKRSAVQPRSVASRTGIEEATQNSHPETGAVMGNSSRPRRRRSFKYIMLTLLTVSFVVCSAPETIYFFLVGFVPNFWIQEWFQVASLLFSCQSLVDPIIFVLTMDKLRTAPAGR
ncbi:hypothetical protein BV898_15378 [Hypsibius exemplaris]|uniref:G-protein coupled receptors family 1 profile domain-containing protein n=1 Tax=Hypsibius exemplaris TaxID=2072580 RepID=A0A9X6NBG1_HYPEX|nr:hypothetical protein BV898_15378 [Hypsibius exemplaris]